MEEHFRGSRLLASALFVAGIAFAAVAFVPEADKGVKIFFGCFAAAEISIALLILNIKVTLDPMGLRYKSATGERTMLWSDADKLYYSSTKLHVHLIPAGTYYNFKLKSASGAKLEFGSGIENAKQLQSKLIEYTYQTMFERASIAFDSGQELDFDAIKLSKPNGVTMKRALRMITIPWEEVASYKIASGKFYIFKRGERFASAPSLSEVANAHVLFGILNMISTPVPDEEEEKVTN